MKKKITTQISCDGLPAAELAVEVIATKVGVVHPDAKATDVSKLPLSISTAFAGRPAEVITLLLGINLKPSRTGILEADLFTTC